MDDTLYRVGVPKMENRRVALVCGENRSIGGEVVGQLAERGFTTILGSHDEERGRAAAAEGMSGVVQVRSLSSTLAICERKG
jgi:NAD(P)-dependent dehydrogenase (short-subunit alcohol dehydrogenase family)